MKKDLELSFGHSESEMPRRLEYLSRCGGILVTWYPLQLSTMA
jgi:hypothetical protein